MRLSALGVSVPSKLVHRPADASSEKYTNRRIAVWFCLSLLYAAICAGLALHQAFGSEYVLADDVRQHVFWMFRFTDRGLFPNDLIADYFQSLAPFGYEGLYRALATFRLDPLLTSKLLPPVLGLVATGYCFGVVMHILRAPAAGFFASILFVQSLWMNTDLCGATPRAFLYAIVPAFLFYTVRKSWLGILATIILQGLFFPLMTFICVGVLIVGLLRWQNGRLRFSADRKDYLVCAAAFFACLLTVLPYTFSSSKFGPVITVEEAKKMPEFFAGGRIAFFDPNPWKYWIKGNGGIHLPSRPKFLWAAFLLPVFFLFGSWFPLLQKMRPGLRPVPQLVLASIGMFFAAHLLLFRLYLPSRYTQHVFRIAMSLAGGISMMVLFDALVRWAEKSAARKQPAKTTAAIATAAILCVAAVFYPLFLKHFPTAGYVTGTQPDLYRFFASQPKDVMIASLSDEANNLPTFARRSVLTNSECAVPFHPAYYRQIRQRGFDLMHAQYSEDLAVVQKLIGEYKIDFLLVDRNAFSPRYVKKNHLIRQFKDITTEIAASLQKRSVPALEKLSDKRYVAFSNEKSIVVDAKALLSAPVTQQ